MLFRASGSRTFSFYHNFHAPPAYYVNGIRYVQDYDLDEYSPTVRAFLTKRQLTKREVYPKVAIMQDMGENYSHVYYQQRLAAGESLYDAKHMQRLYDSDAVNTQFIHSMVCEDYEKNLIEEVLQKRIMNGSVPNYLDEKTQTEIKERTDYWTKVFYEGLPLTDLEVDVQRMYLSGKVLKHTKYDKRKSQRFKVRWTVSDLNLYQDQQNYRMNDPEYFGTAKPQFFPFDLDKALECMYIHQDIQQTSTARRALSWFTDTKAFERGQKRSMLQSTQLLTRFMLYQDSKEFVDVLQLQEDFHIHNSVANMHVWLLYQRLRDFAENKFAFQLREELIETFNKFINSEMEDVQVLRKFKKIEEIDNYLFAIRRNLDFHFFINGATSAQPEYKLDALVWTCIFHEKVPRYSDKVYKMCQYLIQHYYYLKTVDFSTIEKCMVDWSVHRIPVNARESFTRIAANRPLSIEEFEKEKQSPYKTKKYHYNYRQPEELTEQNLQQTFVNMCTTAYIQNKDKTVREENLNLDGMNSKERDEVMFKMKRELEKFSSLPDDDDSFFTAIKNASPLNTQFKIWRKNLFIPLTDQLEEQANRKLAERDEKKHIEANKDQAFFKIPGVEDELYDIEAQKKKNERHQAILKQTIAQEKGLKPEEIDFVSPNYEKKDDPYQDTVDNLPVKRKQKWRLW